MNPYSPPESPLSEDKVDSNQLGLSSRIAIWLFFGISTLQFWGVMQVLIKGWDSFAYGLRTGQITLFSLSLKIAQPASLFLGGVFLLFQRRICVIFLGIWLLFSFSDVAFNGKPLMLFSVGMTLAATFFALHLWKKGRLR